MEICYKKWKKYDEIQLTKNEIELNTQKKSSPFPRQIH